MANETKLYAKLGYGFKDADLLQRALTHSSFGKGNNERLEFLGDSILGWIIAEYLYARFTHAKEGQLSRLRARLVNGVTLSELARELDLGPYLRLGQGELKSGGERRDSILADSMEAVIGAIYLDAGIENCRERVLHWYASRLNDLSLKDNLKDAKTRLQEYLQARRLELPEYVVVATSGKEHEQRFEVACRVPGLPENCIGIGYSRRKAEQEAADLALETLILKEG